MTIEKAQLRALALATFEHLPGVSDPKMIVQASDVLWLLAEIDHLEREAKNDLSAYKSAIERQKELREERENLKAENQRLIEHKQGLINLRETHGFESWSSALVEIDRLRAENDALRKAIYGRSDDLSTAEHGGNAVLSTIQEMRKDAERYRWLKGGRRSAVELDAAFDPYGVPVDESIDEAIAKEAGGD